MLSHLILADNVCYSANLSTERCSPFSIPILLNTDLFAWRETVSIIATISLRYCRRFDFLSGHQTVLARGRI